MLLLKTSRCLLMRHKHVFNGGISVQKLDTSYAAFLPIVIKAPM